MFVAIIFISDDPCAVGCGDGGRRISILSSKQTSSWFPVRRISPTLPRKNPTTTTTTTNNDNNNDTIS